MQIIQSRSYHFHTKHVSSLIREVTYLVGSYQPIYIGLVKPKTIIRVCHCTDFVLIMNVMNLFIGTVNKNIFTTHRTLINHGNVSGSNTQEWT